MARTERSTAGASDPEGITHVGHREQLTDFLQAIDSGGSPCVDGREGRKAVEIIRAIYQIGPDRPGRSSCRWWRNEGRDVVVESPLVPASLSCLTDSSPLATTSSFT